MVQLQTFFSEISRYF